MVLFYTTVDFPERICPAILNPIKCRLLILKPAKYYQKKE